MTETMDVSAEAPASPPTKGRNAKRSLFVGLLGAILLGAAGFYLVFAGFVGGSGDSSAKGGSHGSESAAATLSGLAFVELDPIVISLPPGSSSKFLRFIGQLEVEPAEAEAIMQVMPRILDVLNTYLRAVEVRELEQPSSIARLRAQMLRRIQVVTGEGRVRDLLITEFVLN